MKENRIINPAILRQYDIRGVYAETLTLDDAFQVGYRFGSLVANLGGKKIAVAYDGRLSSEALVNSLVEGLRKTGINIIFLGLGPTPLLYFSVYHAQLDGGIMVTGSHNPPSDNGFKIMLSKDPFFGDALKNLNSISYKPSFILGTVEKNDKIKDLYLETIAKTYTPKKSLKIAFDPGNGVVGPTLKKVISTFSSITPHFINLEIDGTFPVHSPDPTVIENLEGLIKVVKNKNCDLGIAFDGDGDRLNVIDEKGRIVSPEFLLMLFAEELLLRKPGSLILADVKMSQSVFDFIEKKGGKILMVKTGHSFIKEKMKETGALLAGEMSGHLFFSDDYYGYDDAIYAAIRLLRIVEKKPLSELFDKLPRYFSSGETRLKCLDEEKFLIIDRLKNRLIELKISFSDLDGVRVSNDKGWWLVRASNTEPTLITRCEAFIEGDLLSLQEEMERFVKISVL